MALCFIFFSSFTGYLAFFTWYPCDKWVQNGHMFLVSNEFCFVSTKIILTEMGAKGRKKSITKKLKKGASEFSASKDKAADFLVCYGIFKLVMLLQVFERKQH